MCLCAARICSLPHRFWESTVLILSALCLSEIPNQPNPEPLELIDPYIGSHGVIKGIKWEEAVSLSPVPLRPFISVAHHHIQYTRCTIHNRFTWPYICTLYRDAFRCRRGCFETFRWGVILYAYLTRVSMYCCSLCRVGTPRKTAFSTMCV